MTGTRQLLKNHLNEITSKTLTKELRPFVKDAAQTVERDTGHPVEDTLAWFDDAPFEDVQALLREALEGAIKTARKM